MRVSVLTAIILTATIASGAPTTDTRGMNKHDYHHARAGSLHVGSPEMRDFGRRVSKAPAKPAGQPMQQQAQSQSASQQSPPPSQSQQKQQKQQQHPSAASQKQTQKSAAPSSAAGSNGGSSVIEPIDKVDVGLGSNALEKREGRGQRREDGRMLRERSWDHILDDPLDARQWGGAREMDDNDDMPYFL